MLQENQKIPCVPRSLRSKIHVVEANEGDLIVWSSLLPHGAGCNISSRPRLAQFIRMFPALERDRDLVRKRVEMWRWGLPSSKSEVSCGDFYKPAHLTKLGERLLGFSKW